MRFIEKFRNSSWGQGIGGGFLGSICCVLTALAVVVGSSAGAALFGSWMVKYRLEFFILGFGLMVVMFMRTMKKHGFKNKRAIINHIAIMSVMFLVIYGALSLSQKAVTGTLGQMFSNPGQMFSNPGNNSYMTNNGGSGGF